MTVSNVPSTRSTLGPSPGGNSTNNADEHAATVDLSLVAEVRTAVAAELTTARRNDEADDEISDADEAARAEPMIWRQLDLLTRRLAAASQPILSIDEEEAVFRRVKADLFGLGGFEDHIFDPTVENIYVNGCDRVFVSRSGGIGSEPASPIAESDEALIDLVNRWASRLGRTERRFDVANPRLDLRLPGGFRMHAIMEVTARPTITVRCPFHRKVRLADLTKLGSLNPRLENFLAAAVRARCNIIVAGGTGTGKTTLLRSLLFEIPRHERIVTIEDTGELGLAGFPDEHPNVVEMETRQANVEGVGELTMLELTRECLRMSPDRVVIGEVRGAEALYMLKAMSQGNDGSMCTIHADSAGGVADRVRGYCAEGAHALPTQVIDSFFKNAVDLVVHLKVLPDRRRVVSEVIEIQRDADQGIRYNELFRQVPDAPGQALIPPSTDLLERLLRAGMAERLW